MRIAGALWTCKSMMKIALIRKGMVARKRRMPLLITILNARIIKANKYPSYRKHLRVYA